MQRVNLLTLNNIIIIGVLILGMLLGVYTGFKGFSPLTAALLISMVFIIITLIKPWIALSAFFLLVPLENLYVLGGGFSATSTKLIGVYLVFLLLITGSLKYILEVFKNKKVIWLIVFALSATVSILYSKNTPESLNSLYRLYLYIGLYFLLIMMIRDVKTLTSCIWPLIIGGVLSVISPIVLGFGRIQGNLLERYGGLWGDQNEFAALLLIIIPLCYVVFYNAKGLLLRTVSGVSFAVLLSGFFLTYSRGGFIALIALCVLTMFRIAKGKNRIKILGLTVPFIILVFSIFYVTVADNYISRIDTLRTINNTESGSGDTSINIRYYYYFKLGPELFFENPILGVGLRGFKDYNPKNQVAHDTYLEVLTGLGLLGTIPFIIILYLTWKELRTIQYKTRYAGELKLIYSYASAIELSFLTFLVACIFLSLDLSKILWITIALASVLTNILMINTNTEYKRNKAVSSF